MPVYFASLNSGSNANCYYVGNEREAVLVDAGLSCRETERRMKGLGLEMKLLKAVFISHEHSDHISGLENLAKKHQLPVYITEKTYNSFQCKVEPHLIKHFRKNETVQFDELTVKTFSKSHDAVDGHSFMISSNGINIGVITDIGYACKQVLKHFPQCHAAFLESNYCEDMLANGNYPYHLKKRISGDEGHLSNTQALDLFLNYKSEKLSHLILSHLSANNNKPEIVDALFQQHAGNVKVVVASRHEASALFSIEGKSVSVTHNKKQNNRQQLSLF
jgi:phosphoribosyl 1,2-cyclic phosphodiesterase